MTSHGFRCDLKDQRPIVETEISMARTRRKIGEILKGWGVINDHQLNQALQQGESSGQRVGEVLVELGFIQETEVAKAIAEQFDMEYVDLDQPNAINPEHLTLLPAEVIKKYLVLPLGTNGVRLKVLIHDPMDLDTLDDLRFRMNCEIETALAARSKIKECIDRVLGDTQHSIDHAVRAMTLDAYEQSIDVKAISPDGAEQTTNEAQTAQQAPIIRLVNQIITNAVNCRASDIHIEPYADRVRLRYRIDGVCHERDRIPKRTQSAVIARLKIMAGVKVEEKRIPQDGRIKVKTGSDRVDIRFSVCPGYHGENCVMRILRSETAKIGLEVLGLESDTKQRFEKLIRRPNGIFLVTGPTGSGKTTTLYAALKTLNRPDRKIITAEDPVEYNFKGINQCQINEPIGFTFARVLRAMLRQAPNIILVGEIRDKEVADVAIQAALTGHLVFSTLHTNDAPSAITRLIDMGVKPFLVASSLQAVMAQRLVRVLCETCKQPNPAPNKRLLRLCGLTEQLLKGKTIYQSVGCDRCAGTGYLGRTGIYELMKMNNDLRELAFHRAPLNQIRDAASMTGMRNLLGDGRLKILQGVTTPEEIARTAQVHVDVEHDHDDQESITAD